MTSQVSPVVLNTMEGSEIPSREGWDASRPSLSLQRLSHSMTTSLKPKGFRGQVGMENIPRRTLGIFLILVTVFLWTASNFLASVSQSRTGVGVLELIKPPVYPRRQQLLKTVFRHLYQHSILCYIAHPNISANHTSAWSWPYQSLCSGVLARSQGTLSTSRRKILK
jgi:hypothetical protein